MSATSPAGAAVPVVYQLPTVSGGLPPLVGPTCTPATGSNFTPGTTSVACAVTDAKARGDVCSFSVTVTIPAKLSVSRFVAFGDSITWGEDGRNSASESASGGQRFHPEVQFDTPDTYPGALQTELDARYTAQVPSVVNVGSVGEKVLDPATFPRFIRDTSGPYDVVLLMEGADDLAPTTSAASIAAGLGRMIDNARSRGLRVFLATIPPENASSPCIPSVSRRQRRACFAAERPGTLARRVQKRSARRRLSGVPRRRADAHRSRRAASDGSRLSRHRRHVLRVHQADARDLAANSGHDIDIVQGAVRRSTPASTLTFCGRLTARTSATPQNAHTIASGSRLACPRKPIFIPRLNAARGSWWPRKSRSTPPDAIVCVLSARSPSRNAGHRNSRHGMLNIRRRQRHRRHRDERDRDAVSGQARENPSADARRGCPERGEPERKKRNRRRRVPRAVRPAAFPVRVACVQQHEIDGDSRRDESRHSAAIEHHE